MPCLARARPRVSLPPRRVSQPHLTFAPPSLASPCVTLRRPCPAMPRRRAAVPTRASPALARAQPWPHAPSHRLACAPSARRRLCNTLLRRGHAILRDAIATIHHDVPRPAAANPFRALPGLLVAWPCQRAAMRHLAPPARRPASPAPYLARPSQRAAMRHLASPWRSRAMSMLCHCSPAPFFASPVPDLSPLRPGPAMLRAVLAILHCSAPSRATASPPLYHPRVA